MHQPARFAPIDRVHASNPALVGHLSSPSISTASFAWRRSHESRKSSNSSSPHRNTARRMPNRPNPPHSRLRRWAGWGWLSQQLRPLTATPVREVGSTTPRRRPRPSLWRRAHIGASNSAHPTRSRGTGPGGRCTSGSAGRRRKGAGWSCQLSCSWSCPLTPPSPGVMRHRLSRDARSPVNPIYAFRFDLQGESFADSVEFLLGNSIPRGFLSRAPSRTRAPPRDSRTKEGATIGRNRGATGVSSLRTLECRKSSNSSSAPP
jgi:hypothetical protein